MLILILDIIKRKSYLENYQLILKIINKLNNMVKIIHLKLKMQKKREDSLICPKNNAKLNHKSNLNLKYHN